jgi:hypothetical protein
MWTGPLPTGAEAGQRFVEQMRAHVRLGVTAVHVMPGNDPVAAVENLGEHVLPHLAGI